MLTFQQLECCGVHEVCNLDAGYIDITYKYIKLNTPELFIKSFLHNVFTHFGSSMRTGAIIAFTLPQQKVAVAALQAMGFVQGDTFTNPNTRHQLTCWYHAPRVWKRDEVFKIPAAVPRAPRKAKAVIAV